MLMPLPSTPTRVPVLATSHVTPIPRTSATMSFKDRPELQIG